MRGKREKTPKKSQNRQKKINKYREKREKPVWKEAISIWKINKKDSQARR